MESLVVSLDQTLFPQVPLEEDISNVVFPRLGQEIDVLLDVVGDADDERFEGIVDAGIHDQDSFWVMVGIVMMLV